MDNPQTVEQLKQVNASLNFFKGLVVLLILAALAFWMYTDYRKSVEAVDRAQRNMDQSARELGRKLGGSN